MMRPFLIIASLLLTQPVFAQLRLPSFLSDEMVLQQKKVNRIWGWAGAQQLVSVTFKEKNYTALSGINGEWQVFLEPSAAGNAGSISISAGDEKKELKNILIGEVWICSGQSNMEWKMNGLLDMYKTEIESVKNNDIRFVVVNKTMAGTPQQDVTLEKKWSAINPSNTGDCSAVAYWYAKKLYQQLKVPIGLIVTSWGGTPAEAWTSFEGLHDFPHYTNRFMEKIRPLALSDLAGQQQLLKDKFQQLVKDKGSQVHEMEQPGFDDADWKEMQLPGSWDTKGFAAFDGVIVYRIVFNVLATNAGKEATLNLPAIDDMDSTYINGVFVGSVDQWNLARTYKVPAGILKAGKNILAIRVQDNQGGGGLSAAEDHYNITVGNNVIRLTGNTKYNVIAAMETITSGNGDIEDQPTLLFNGMIAPLLPLAIRGAIWYQGESNADTDPYEYRTLFPAMIRDWRNRWNQGDFPFLFVQLSSYGPLKKMPDESRWAVLREGQTQTLALPNTAMAVTIDVGNPADIHPHQKKEVGERLADAAMKMQYGKSTITSAGPQLKSYQINSSQAVLQFSNTGKGLLVKGTSLKHFAIAGADKKFIWADAVVKGNEVIVSSKQIAKPLAVRYAWADSPVDANLFNKDGYPAVPFRTDDWKVQ